MNSTLLSSKFHATNRRVLAKTIGEDAIAVIDTADVLGYLDNDLPFRPDPNFFYLTGITEPEAVLLLVPGHANPEARELLFVSGTSEHVATWQGDRLTLQLASELSGITHVLPLTELPYYLDRFLARYQTVYLNAQESIEGQFTSPSIRRSVALQEHSPLHQLRSALPQLGRQRATKTPREIELVQEAVNVTAYGLEAAWRALKPGRFEFELEAELTAEFIRHGACNGFSPIVASGIAATIMHYTKNRSKIGHNDMVLFDVGSQVGCYAADVSRVAPASGAFSPRQRDVYAAVLKAQKIGIEYCRPGESVWSVDEKIREVLTEEIKKLGLTESLRTYYPTISHHLGLDLHDTGDSRLVFEPGMIITCEPGLYLREEGIGVRLEDDLVIREDGCEVLSSRIPKEPDEVEAIVNGNSK